MKIITRDGETTLTLTDRQFGVIMSCLSFAYVHWEMKNPEVTWTERDIQEVGHYLLNDVLHADAEHTFYNVQHPDSDSDNKN